MKENIDNTINDYFSPSNADNHRDSDGLKDLIVELLENNENKTIPLHPSFLRRLILT